MRVARLSLYAFSFTLLLFSCSGDNGTGNIPSVTWQTAIGTNVDEVATRILLLPDGGLIAAGWVANFAQTDFDIYLLRTDYNGKEVWDRRIVTPRLDYFNGVALSSSGVLQVTGWMMMNDSTGANAILVQADLSGEIVRTVHFERRFRGAYNDAGVVILPVGDGGGFMVGTTQNDVDSSTEGFLVRFDSTGQVLHQHIVREPHNDLVSRALLTPDNTILIAGAVGDTGSGRTDSRLTCMDTLGVVLWRQTYASVGSSMLNALALDHDGSIVIAGWADTTGNGDPDLFVARTDAAGQPSWSKVHGGRWADQANAVIVAMDGSVVVAGSTASFGAQATDAYLLKCDPNGQILWERRYGAQSFDEAYDLVQAADSGFILAGSTRSIGSGGKDVYLIKTDAEGNAPAPEIAP